MVCIGKTGQRIFKQWKQGRKIGGFLV